jgi:hypothetical protein
MKKFLIMITTVLLSALLVSAGAENSQTLNEDESDLVYIGETASWILLAAWEDYQKNKEIKMMHSVTQFRQPRVLQSTDINYTRIWSYGYIDCRLHQLFIQHEFYTDNDNNILLNSNFSSGEYIVDLETNVILQTFFIYVCRQEKS